MNSILLLSILLVVLGGGTFSSATMSDSFKSFEKKSSDRDRRDLTDFQTQIQKATALDIGVTSVCPTFPCASTIDPNLCPSLCSPDGTAYFDVINSIIDCYLGGLCGLNMTAITLTKLNISIISGSYDLDCFLYGEEVTMTLKNVAYAVYTISPATAYVVFIQFQYVFEGLTLSCQPQLPSPVCSTQPTIISQNCSQVGTRPTGTSPTGTRPTGASQSVGLPCCGNSLLNRLICLVQQLVGSLGVNLYILSCNCNCGGSSFLGKRQAADSTAFEMPITITQNEKLKTLMLHLPERGFTSCMESTSIETQISTENPIPNPTYELDINNGIKAVFADYYIAYKLQYNFYYIIISIIYQFMNDCPKC